MPTVALRTDNRGLGCDQAANRCDHPVPHRKLARVARQLRVFRWLPGVAQRWIYGRPCWTPPTAKLQRRVA